MDIQMPELDGYGAIHAVAWSKFVKPIIALTAHGMIDRKRCIGWFSSHLTKPVNRATDRTRSTVFNTSSPDHLSMQIVLKDVVPQASRLHLLSRLLDEIKWTVLRCVPIEEKMATVIKPCFRVRGNSEVHVCASCGGLNPILPTPGNDQRIVIDPAAPFCSSP
jgi:CheY-like chemotaxis protein